MSSTSLGVRFLRSSLTAGGTALLVLLPTVPARASTPPTDPTALSVAIGDRFADLAWTDGDGVGAIVRDVSGLTSPYLPTQGRAVTTSSATAAHDTGFTNSALTTYAIWSTSSDGTTSANPLVQDVAAAPLVPTSISLNISHVQLDYGVPVTLDGVLTRTVGSVSMPVAGQPLDVVGVDGGTNHSVLLKRVTTDAAGKVRTTLRPYRTLTLTLRFAGDAFSKAAVSNAKTLRVVPRIGASVSPAAIVLHETSAVTGSVAPAYRNARVLLQAYYSHAWHSLAETRTSATGTYGFTISPALGLHAYRAVLTATPAWVAAGSPAVDLRVDARDLASGMQGSDVLALQQRLKALHYEPGALDGRFGYDLTHAVIAFQKVERLTRTGRWTKAERVRVAHPTAWKVRYPSSGLAVEIDITRQVLVLSKAGVVQKVIDVSTGSERVYYQEGVRNVAHTPRGRFHITHKIDGIRVSKLGELYRPSYFYQGYAIHGNGSVPATPASHGCVRITNPNADRLFTTLVVGTPVAVYDE